MILIIYALALLGAVCATVFFLAFIKTIEWIRYNPRDIFSYVSAAVLFAIVLLNIGCSIFLVSQL